MPIIKSAKKRSVQTKKRTERLLPYRTRMLTMFKNMQKWGAEKNAEKVATHFSEAVQAIDVAAKKNILPKNNAARKKSLIQKIFSALVKEAPKAVNAKKAAPKKTTAKKAAAKKTATTAKKAAPKKPAAKKAAPKKKEA